MIWASIYKKCTNNHTISINTITIFFVSLFWGVRHHYYGLTAANILTQRVDHSLKAANILTLTAIFVAVFTFVVLVLRFI